MNTVSSLNNQENKYEKSSGINNTLLNIFDWIIPIDETCITLNQMSINKLNNKNLLKIQFICLLITFFGLKLALFSEFYPVISFTISIFLTVTFSSTTIIRKITDYLLYSLVKIHKNNPIIYTLFQFCLAILLSYLIDRYLSNIYNYIGAAYLSLLIYRRLENFKICKNLKIYYKVILEIILFGICIINQFLIHKFCNRFVMIAMYSIVGVIYFLIGLFILIFILSNEKYGYGPNEISRNDLKHFSNIISIIIFICFIYQFYNPIFKYKNKKPLNNISF